MFYKSVQRYRLFVFVCHSLCEKNKKRYTFVAQAVRFLLNISVATTPYS